jgi:hypothetical protein
VADLKRSAKKMKLPRPKSIFLYLAVIVLSYFVAWTAAYLTTVGTNLAFYFEYLALFWKLDGLELPAFTGLLSIVFAIPLSAVASWWLRQLLKKTEEEPNQSLQPTAPSGRG